MTDPTHPNIALLSQLDLRNLDECAPIFADDFVWHYFNPKLSELEGDHRGIEGLKSFFMKLGRISNGSFRVNVIDTRAVGDELVVVHVCDSLMLGGDSIEIDVVVVWRIVNGKIVEAWDIPSAYSRRDIQQD